MGSRGRSADIKFLVDTLRRVTTAVQVLPFIYSAAYAITLIVYSYSGPSVQDVLDYVFYVSPVCIASFLFLSRVLNLCRWHKAACALPLIPSIVSLIDTKVVSLTSTGAYAFNGAIILMSVLLLVAAYKVFLK